MYFKKFFSFNKKPEVSKKHVPSLKTSDLIPETEEIELNIPYNRIIKNYNFNKETVLIVDDSKGIVEILKSTILNFVKNSNIITFYNEHAGFILEKTLFQLNKTSKVTINTAIIDIILPGKIVEGNKQKRIDGIDIAILLNKKYNCNNFLFFTGNIGNEYLEFIKLKSVKFHDHFGKNLSDFILNKNNFDSDVFEIELKKLANQKDYSIK